MPPKKGSTKGVVRDIGLTASNVAVLRSTLMNLKSFECDWEAVRTDINITHKKHATRDFGRAIAKLDLKLQKGKIISTANDDGGNDDNDDDNDDDEASVAAEPKVAAPAAAVTGTKRKAGQEGTAAKGKKVKKETEKAEPTDNEDHA